QSEDGIRDFHVTGVQTCALPILVWRFAAPLSCQYFRPSPVPRLCFVNGTLTRTEGGVARCLRRFCVGSHAAAVSRKPAPAAILRSEERRVGKERKSASSTQQQRQ